MSALPDVMDSDTAFHIRDIAPEDNAAVADIIRAVMPEIGACGPGYALNDPEVDHMYEAFDHPRARYFVAELDGRIVGGGGVNQLKYAGPELCELQKLYILPEVRGKGLGRTLMGLSLDAARECGYRQCYIETLTHLDPALALYKQYGFEKIEGPMGNTGHFSCNSFYLKDL